MSKFFVHSVNGILLLNKSLHLSSNAALQEVRRLFRIKKAGHTGSLDPLATGMLPLCFGEATKFSQYLLEADKVYQVEASLGKATSTGDAEGAIIQERPLNNFSIEKLNYILPHFTGSIEQIPPMFSALKHNGEPLYKLARKGIEVERKSRAVTIHQLKVLEVTQSSFTLEVRCSKGTYIRTLIEDMALALGTCGYVSSLHRLAVHPYENFSMLSIEMLKNMDGDIAELKKHLLPLNTSVGFLPKIELTKDAAFYIKQGQSITSIRHQAPGLIQMFDDKGFFLGVGEMSLDGRLLPRRMVSSVA